MSDAADDMRTRQGQPRRGDTDDVTAVRCRQAGFTDASTVKMGRADVLAIRQVFLTQDSRQRVAH